MTKINVLNSILFPAEWQYYCWPFYKGYLANRSLIEHIPPLERAHPKLQTQLYTRKQACCLSTWTVRAWKSQCFRDEFQSFDYHPLHPKRNIKQELWPCIRWAPSRPADEQLIYSNLDNADDMNLDLNSNYAGVHLEFSFSECLVFQAVS